MEEFSVSLPTAKKYISMPEDKISALDYRAAKKRKSVLDDYINIIYKMLRDKIYPPIVISYVVKSGYDGNIETLETKIKRVAKNNFNVRLGINWAYKFAYSKDILIFKRNEILRYITTKNPKTKRNENIVKYIDIIKEKYKMVGVLADIYNDFHETIMGKDPTLLKSFIDKYEFSVIQSFISGLKDDIIPVSNAISSDVSSGFVEGNNNKFKLIKRILYGRANLDTLFKKCYLAFKFGLDYFDISHISKNAILLLNLDLTTLIYLIL
jgi:hypothetical protein